MHLLSEKERIVWFDNITMHYAPLQILDLVVS